jgi:hypothetical protein
MRRNHTGNSLVFKVFRGLIIDIVRKKKGTLSILLSLQIQASNNKATTII